MEKKRHMHRADSHIFHAQNEFDFCGINEPTKRCTRRNNNFRSKDTGNRALRNDKTFVASDGQKKVLKSSIVRHGPTDGYEPGFERYLIKTCSMHGMS